jgi:tripartite-type tricarboxylate transporter receptor subunit TctC
MMTVRNWNTTRRLKAPTIILALAAGILATWFAPILPALAQTAAQNSAQEYPAKPIRLIVPFAAGGPNDISARIVADALSKSLRQPVVVDNRPGAGGNLAAEAAARSAPDGYTLFWAQAATHGINPSLYRKLGYDAIRDFAPIAVIVSEPLVLVTSVASPWSDVRGLIAAAKAEPGRFHFGSGGFGTTPHMAGELFSLSAGAKLLHVPYRGNGPAVADTIAGRVQLVFDGINSSLGHIRGGSLKALAVTSRERSAALPEVPALAELEMFAGYDVRSWGGVAAPAGTPADVIARLSGELIEIGRRADVQRRFSELGANLAVSTPNAMDGFVRGEIPRWRAVIERSGIAALD